MSPFAIRSSAGRVLSQHFASHIEDYMNMSVQRVHQQCLQNFDGKLLGDRLKTDRDTRGYKFKIGSL